MKSQDIALWWMKYASNKMYEVPITVTDNERLKEAQRTIKAIKRVRESWAQWPFFCRCLPRPLGGVVHHHSRGHADSPAHHPHRSLRVRVSEGKLEEGGD